MCYCVVKLDYSCHQLENHQTVSQQEFRNFLQKISKQVNSHQNVLVSDKEGQHFDPIVQILKLILSILFSVVKYWNLMFGRFHWQWFEPKSKQVTCSFYSAEMNINIFANKDKASRESSFAPTWSIHAEAVKLSGPGFSSCFLQSFSRETLALIYLVLNSHLGK